MSGIRTDHARLSSATVNRNEWESTLGRLDAIVDQINRALHRAAIIEELKKDVRVTQSQKMIEHRKIGRPVLLIEG